MKIGASFSSKRPLKWQDVANSNEVPLFLSKLHDNVKKGIVSKTDSNLLLNYLDNLNFGFNSQDIRVGDTADVINTIFPTVEEAVTEAARVVGQVLNYAGANQIVQEILFFVFAYFNEINMSQPTDMIGYMRQSGSTLAKYLDALNDKNVDVSRVKTLIQKDTWNIINWFKSMVRSNYLVVHNAIMAISVTSAQTMAHQFFELGCVLAPQFDNPKKSLDDLYKIATNLSEFSSVSTKVKASLKERVKQVKEYQQLLDAEKPGTVDPWITAMVMKKIYDGKSIDSRILNGIVFDRTGMSLKEFEHEMDTMISALKTQIWVAVFSLNNTEKVESYLSDLTGIQGRWTVFGWEKDKDDSDDEISDDEKLEKQDKGKEEVDLDYMKKQEKREQKKRERRVKREEEKLDHFVRLEEAKAATLEKAAKADQDNPYSDDIKNEADIQAARERIINRFNTFLKQTSARIVQLELVKTSIQNSNIQLRAGANVKALEEYNPEKGLTVIQEALDALDEIGRDAEDNIQEYLYEPLLQLHKFQYMLNVLNRKEQELKSSVGRATTKYTLWIVGILFVGAFIYFAYRMNIDCVRRTTTTLQEMKDKCAATYTNSIFELWERIWTQRYLDAQASTPVIGWRPLVSVDEYDLTPSTISSIAGNAMNQLSTFVSNTINLSTGSYTVEYVRTTLQNYQNFIRIYIEGLERALQETAVHISVLKTNGLDITSQVALQARINESLIAYKNTLLTSSMDGLTQEQLKTLLTNLRDRIGLSINLIQETYRLLQAKMLTGTVPATANIMIESGGAILNGNTWLGAAALFGTSVVKTTVGVGVGTGKAVKMAYDYILKTTSPQIEDLTPYGLFKVIGPGGRSPEYMDVLKKVGDASINLILGSFILPFILIAHVATIPARLFVGHMDPAQVFIRFAIEGIPSLLGIWHLMWAAINEAAVAQWQQKWGLMGGLMAFAAMCFPTIGIFSKIMDYAMRKKMSVSQLPSIPPPAPVPQSRPDERSDSTADIQFRKPTQTNPQLFVTPQTRQIEPPTIDVPEMVEEQNLQLVEEVKNRLAMVRQKMEERKRQKEKEQSSRVEVIPDNTERLVSCHVCGDEARFMCSHCFERSYCHAECGKIDWSVEKKSHLSLHK